MHWLIFCCVAAALSASPDESITVDNVLVTLIEQVEVPAREAGVLDTIEVREGQRVAAGDLLARLDDKQAQLARKKTEIELEVARAEAENDVDVRFARKSTDVTRAELKRASESMEKYNRSVSATELDRLRLETERAALQIEQAEHELKVARFTERLKQNELEFADLALERLRIKAPLAGVVVEVSQRPGEWVEPGKTMFRVVRIDRLRVEGFVDAHLAGESLVGRPVKLVTDLPGGRSGQYAGKVAFVSPEVDPVNGQVRVWAEVDNPKLDLRPGLHGSLHIDALPAEAPQPNLAR